MLGDQSKNVIESVKFVTARLMYQVPESGRHTAMSFAGPPEKLGPARPGTGGSGKGMVTVCTSGVSADDEPTCTV